MYVQEVSYCKNKSRFAERNLHRDFLYDKRMKDTEENVLWFPRIGVCFFFISVIS